VDAFDAGRAVLTGEAAHHLGRVLRAERGQLYELSDGSAVWLGKVESSAKERVEFRLLEPVPCRTSSLDKTLVLSIVKFEAFEWAIEKATELGVDRIVPAAAARSDKALLERAPKRAERWKKIVFEASQQSRRVRLPVVEAVMDAAAAFKNQRAALKVLLSERAEASPLGTVLERAAPAGVALAVGPEGGWTDGEVAAASEAGFAEASLGALILRTETAVAVALGNLNYALEREA
jgi:16S rRNA (uracil1498-N3)-methyltransferase